VRLRSNAGVSVIAFAALSIGAPSLAAAPAQERAAYVKTGSPGPAEIARALEAVKADPNLATERTIKTLQWKDAKESKPSGRPAWLEWLDGLFRWVEQTSRILVWGAAVLLAGLLAVYIIRIVQRNRPARDDESFVAPTHVRDLDIRPETLPENIGLAARALWDRGEHRAALALLYRGLLSRLAHVHRIPIRDSSTEGDCLSLAANYLPHARREYTSHLVRVWQRFVYGGEAIEASTLYMLCDGFAAALDSAPALDAAAGGGAA
jgi:hypothetical protein